MSSLLHYTVHQYIKKFERNDAGTEKVSLPLPDPSDMGQAMGVNFDELGKELVRIQKDFEGMDWTKKIRLLSIQHLLEVAVLHFTLFRNTITKYDLASHYVSHPMGKPTICLGENKGADQLVTAKLISAFVFATRIVQFLLYLTPKFQASSLLL